METYYDNNKFTDWIHGISKAPMLKAQHPDYEIYRTGVHADRNISCADCHMPYRSEGGVKYTDHKIQSPLNNISNSCQICHRESEEKLRNNVNERQDKILQLKQLVETALVNAHFEAKSAWDAGASEDEMKPALTLIRHAQWRWDWIAAANGMGFHSPNEALRILGTSIQKAEEARLILSKILAKHGILHSIQIPDITSKEKAQKVIGLKIDAIIKEKQIFLKTVIPVWDNKISGYKSYK